MVPKQLVSACRGVPDRRAWLERLPDAVRELGVKWSFSLSAPFDGDDVSCAWVAPAVRRDGSSAVLKLGMPHMEAAHERHALRFWDGDATVREWLDTGLVRDGLRAFEELSRPSADDVLLFTDLHAGNVLRATREEWLAIDPKPFVGDRAYDATQHPFNCQTRLLADTDSTIGHWADLLEVDAERVRLWMFARAAAGPRDVWSEDSMALAKALA